MTEDTSRFQKRARNGGWSKDCIWMSSSLTIPPVEGDVNGATTRCSPVAGRGGAGDAPSPLRVAPIASISSMNPMAPPSFRAAFRNALKNERIRDAVIPNHMDWKAGEDTNMNGTPVCLAMALAR